MKKNYVAFMLVAVLAYGCRKDDAPLPDNTVKFGASELGIGASETSKIFSVQLDRAAAQDVQIQLNIAETGVVYGTDYVTEPVAANGLLSLVIPAGKAEVPVTVTKKAAYYGMDAAVVFTLSSVKPEGVLGNPKSLTFKFAEILSEGSKMILNGGEGGANAENMVYVNLSGNTQTAVLRSSWNLGLYCGDQDVVKLNNATTSTATASVGTESLLGKVMDDLTTSKYKELVTLAPHGGSGAAGFEILDSWDGDITKTIVKLGKEYVMNPDGAADPLYIIQVDKKDADTYTVRYSKITEAIVHSIDVKKDKAYDYKYVSFADEKVVPVEPVKTKWDILYGKFSYHTSLQGPDIPYTFADLIFSNSANGVEVAQVQTSVVTYDAFGTENLTPLTFSKTVDAIGSGWRKEAGPGMPPIVKQDVFYVIKDVVGNYYKLRFLSMSEGDGGTRGKPEIEYKLVK